MVPISKFFSGIAHAVKSNESTSYISSVTAHPGTSNCPVDDYHTLKCNKVNPNANIKITLVMESPPIMIYGPPDESSGALFNGTLVLEVLPRSQKETIELLEIRGNSPTPSPVPGETYPGDGSQDASTSIPSAPAPPPPSLSALKSAVSLSQLSEEQLNLDYVQMKEVRLYFIQVVTYGKPFLPNSADLEQCLQCRRQVTELACWDVLTKRTAFVKGSSHSYPFSYLIPGSFPPTTILSNCHTSITYELVCKAKFVNNKGKEDLINLSLPIMIRRSVLRGHDRNSLRVFPPTDVTATAAIPNVAYPRSTFPVEIRMDNIATKDRRWRMRKLNWRVEESVRIKTHHCNKHVAKYGLCVDFTKHKQKGRKLNKNSGGVNNPTYNYFYDAPLIRNRRTENRRSGSNRDGVADREGQGDGPSDQSEDSDHHEESEPSDHPVAAAQHPINPTDSAPDLSPFASNWSLNASDSHAPHYSSIGDALSSSITTETRQNMSLASPDEVVLPLNNSEPSLSSSKRRNPELYVEEIRTLSSGEMKSGWKSDFSNKGRIELVVEVSVMDLMSMGFNSANSNITTITSENCDSPLFDPSVYLETGANCSCDIEDRELGIYVSHNLIMEAVVAEELIQSSGGYGKPVTTGSSTSGTTRVMRTLVPEETLPQQRHLSNQIRQLREQEAAATPDVAGGTSERRGSSSSTNSHHDGGTGPDSMRGNREDAANHVSAIPTGVARVLRMQFKVVMTERSGLGVSWDDEVPPTYNAVGSFSPPTYQQATSNNNTPLLSSLVIPLDDDGLPDEANAVIVTEPEMPRLARIRQLPNAHLTTPMSQLDLGL
ncbi:DEKNAAC103095 [Brettanomyces naardenensis]|uniref:DEKNAAC103095 n=1 Tax=Brettanomyces naardenensis TaxID=13370 RepID=A0A448YMB1_BRENA|nr:DEKNAAC103095 [Brettanomyces naardenensis]